MKMKKLILPALGTALAIGLTQAAAAADILVAQLMFMGQPGQTGNANRTLPPGSPGVASVQCAGARPLRLPDRSQPHPADPLYRRARRAELCRAGAGRPRRARRGRAPAAERRPRPGPTSPASAARTASSCRPTCRKRRRPSRRRARRRPPARRSCKREQQPSGATTQSRHTSGQAQSGTTGAGKPAQKGMSKGPSEAEATAALNALGAEGLRPGQQAGAGRQRLADHRDETRQAGHRADRPADQPRHRTLGSPRASSTAPPARRRRFHLCRPRQGLRPCKKICVRAPPWSINAAVPLL